MGKSYAKERHCAQNTQPSPPVRRFAPNPHRQWITLNSGWRNVVGFRYRGYVIEKILAAVEKFQWLPSSTARDEHQSTQWSPRASIPMTLHPKTSNPFMACPHGVIRLEC